MNDLHWPITAWRRRLILLLTVITFLIALPIGAFTADRYRSTTTVYVNPNAARAANDTSDPSAQQVMMDAFVSSASSSEAFDAGAAASQISPDELRDTVVIAPIGTSNSVSVTAEAHTQRAAEAATSAIAKYALTDYSKSSLDRVNGTADYLRARYADATKALNDYLTQVGEAAPEERYTAAQQRLIDASAGISAGNTAALRSELTRLQPIVLRFRELLAAQTQLGNIQQDAQARSLELQASIGSANSIASASPTQTEELSPIVSALRFAIFLALLVALIVAAMLYAIYFREAHRRERASHTSPTSGDDASEGSPGSSLDADTDKLQVQSLRRSAPSPRPR